MRSRDYPVAQFLISATGFATSIIPPLSGTTTVNLTIR